MTLQQQIQEIEREYYAPILKEKARKKRIAEMRQKIKDVDEFVFFAYLRRAKELIDKQNKVNENIEIQLIKELETDKKKYGCDIPDCYDSILQWTDCGINPFGVPCPDITKLQRRNIDNLIRAKKRRKNKLKQEEKQRIREEKEAERLAKIEEEKLRQLKVALMWAKRYFEQNPEKSVVSMGGSIISKEMCDAVAADRLEKQLDD